MKIGRRAFVSGIAAATGGVVYSKGLTTMLAQAAEDTAVPMIQRDAWTNQPVDAFDTEKRALVSAIAETIIPRTDTPGAIDADVPKFIELLYDQWMAPPEQALFDKGLQDVDRRAGGAGEFAASDAGTQKALLEALEEEQGGHPWFDFGGETVAKNGTDAPFLALFKEITVVGFFMSEVGAKQVLRYAPMSGQFDGDTKLAWDDSSWAAEPFM